MSQNNPLDDHGPPVDHEPLPRPRTPERVAAIASLDDAVRAFWAGQENRVRTRGYPPALGPDLPGLALRDGVIRNAEAQVAQSELDGWFKRRLAAKPTSADRGLLSPISELLDREIARAYKDDPKVKKLLGRVYVERKQDLATALAETNLAELLEAFSKKLPPVHGLDSDDVAAYEAVRKALANAKKALGIKNGPITDVDIKKLVTDKNDAGTELLAAASMVCKRPRAIDAALADGSLAAVRYNLTGDKPIDELDTAAAYVKALRAKATNTYFATEAMQRMRNAAKGILKDPAVMDSLVAFVGFNRVMSPKNLLGASLASDIDFKAVLDDFALDTLLAAEDPSSTPESRKVKITALQDAMYEQLQGVEQIFLKRFALVVEVQKFALKGLSLVSTHAATEEVEKNFLTTAVENQMLMGGNPEVQRKFTKIILEKLVAAPIMSNPDEPGLPARVFSQYLGESDKGSIETIPWLGKIRSALAKLVGELDDGLLDTIGALGDGFFGRLARKLHLKGGDATTREAVKQRLLTAEGMLDALESPELKKFVKARASAFGADIDLLQNKSQLTEAQLVDADFARMKVLLKNLKAFSTSNASARVATEADANESNWVFSNKYSGCRINDFFDATSLQRYVARRGVLDQDLPDDRPALGHSAGVRQALAARYLNAKHVAEGINGFAIQLQALVYRRYMGELAHDEIDHLYDKMTADQFAELFESPDARARLLRSLKATIDQLKSLEADVPTQGSAEVDAYRSKLKVQIAALEETLSEAGSAVALADADARALAAKRLGLKMMRAVGTVTVDTANLLDPRTVPPPIDAAFIQSDPPEADGRTRRKTSVAGWDVVAQRAHPWTRAKPKPKSDRRGVVAGRRR